MKSDLDVRYGFAGKRARPRHPEKFRYFLHLLYVAAACCFLASFLISPFSAPLPVLLLWGAMRYVAENSKTTMHIGKRRTFTVDPGLCVEVAALFLFGLSFALCVGLTGRMLQNLTHSLASPRDPRKDAAKEPVPVAVTIVTYTVLQSLTGAFPVASASSTLFLIPLVFAFQSGAAALTHILSASLYALRDSVSREAAACRYFPSGMRGFLFGCTALPFITVLFLVIPPYIAWVNLLILFGLYQAKSRAERRADAFAAIEDTVKVLTQIFYSKDKYTVRHTARVRQYAEIVARRIGLSADQVAEVGWAAELHDIGKIFVKDEVLHKRTSLTCEEFEHMKNHVKLDRILEPLLAAQIPIAEILNTGRLHHERFDGKGYPLGLKGTAIPVAARIISVADAWDAMTAGRAYRPSISGEEAIEILLQGSGTQWDPEIVQAFVKAFRLGEFNPVMNRHNLWVVKKQRETLEQIEKILVRGA